MKILGLDEYRTLRGSGALKFFELEGVPNSDWVSIFQNLFAQDTDQAWIEGYCIVTNCPTSEISTRRIYLQSKCDEATEMLKSKGVGL